MKPHYTFKNISPLVYEEIKKFINSTYKIQVLTKKASWIEETFDILDESIKVHYYTKGTLLFQSSPTNKTYAKLISDINEKISLDLHDEIDQAPTLITSDVKYVIGCDESGVGETFGSMFLGCVTIDAENLKNIEKIFDNPNIKELKECEIIDKYEKIKKYCKIFEKKCDASEMDKTNSKNTLLDQKYEELLRDAISGKDKSCVIIDDYGIQKGLKLFFDKLRSKENVVIAEHQADEKYVICQAASVVARKERLEEVRNLNREFKLQDESGKIIYPGSGNANNPQTMEYLEAFMKLYPKKDLPPFVRRKWSNVKKLLQKKR